VVVRRPAPAPDDSSVRPRPINPPPPQPVRVTAGSLAEPHSVRPRRFDSAQEVADKFKEGSPVIMNLEGCERDVARRLIDFASGICYALNGSMEKVATGVYLLKPYGARHDG
jgi:cell division inhibitor SepF